MHDKYCSIEKAIHWTPKSSLNPKNLTVHHSARAVKMMEWGVLAGLFQRAANDLRSNRKMYVIHSPISKSSILKYLSGDFECNLNGAQCNEHKIWALYSTSSPCYLFVKISLFSLFAFRRGNDFLFLFKSTHKMIYRIGKSSFYSPHDEITRFVLPLDHSKFGFRFSLIK